MKKPILMCLLIFLTIPVVGASDTEITTGVNSVVVYRQSAQIHRTASVRLDAGRNELVFTGLSHQLQPASIRLEGDGKFIILSLTHRTNYLNEQVREEQLDSLFLERDSLQSEIETSQVTAGIIERELNILLNNSALKGNENLTSTALKQAMDYFHEKLTELETRKYEVNKSIEGVKSRLDKVNRQISEYRNNQKANPTSEITAVVQAESGGSVQLNLSYMVNGAGWYPAYDIRVDDLEIPAHMTYKANIYQSTGVDWKDIELTVSSAVPRYDSSLPGLSPWYVDFLSESRRKLISEAELANLPTAGELGITEIRGTVREAGSGTPIPTANILIKNFNRGTSTDENGNFTLRSVPPGAKVLRVTFVGYEVAEVPITSSRINVRLTPGTTGLDELVVSGYGMEAGTPGAAPALQGKSLGVPATQNQSFTSFSYRIDVPYSVPSDGSEVMADIRSDEIEAEYRYMSVPKLREKAYLAARIANWEEYNFLPGTANLFFEKTYVGQTFLDPRTTGDTLAISLGEDESVVVERNKRRDFEEKNFFRSRVRETLSWEISVRNTKNRQIQIDIEDQVPVSMNEDIDVKLTERSGGAFDSDTGLLRWNMTLEPNQEKNLILTFEVEYPRGRKIQYR